MDPNNPFSDPHLMYLMPIFGIFAIVGIFIYIIPFWMIFKKAGFSPWLALLLFIPLANIIILYVLAFSQWKVVPIAQTPPPFLRPHTHLRIRLPLILPRLRPRTRTILTRAADPSLRPKLFQETAIRNSVSTASFTCGRASSIQAARRLSSTLAHTRRFASHSVTSSVPGCMPRFTCQWMHPG